MKSFIFIKHSCVNCKQDLRIWENPVHCETVSWWNSSTDLNSVIWILECDGTLSTGVSLCECFADGLLGIPVLSVHWGRVCVASERLESEMLAWSYPRYNQTLCCVESHCSCRRWPDVAMQSHPLYHGYISGIAQNFVTWELLQNVVSLACLNLLNLLVMW